MDAEEILSGLVGRVVTVSGSKFCITGYLEYCNFFYEVNVFNAANHSASVRFCHIEVETILGEKSDHGYEHKQGSIFLKQKLARSEIAARKKLSKRAAAEFERIKREQLNEKI